MANNPALTLAETLQTAHINYHPDPAHDVNPSSTASKKYPVRFRDHPRRPSSSSSGPKAEDLTTKASDEISIDILQPTARTSTLPPLPDLRFEQSYLARIKPYSDEGDYKMVAWYTFWDHLVMPLTQGLVWNLVLFGWRNWNKDVHFRGQTTGARLRRWWWKTNNWGVPGAGMQGGKGRDVGEFSWAVAHAYCMPLWNMELCEADLQQNASANAGVD